MELTQIFGALGSNIFMLVAFVSLLSIIVAVHEYGHYIVGRWCGIKAEVFSIGFGKVLVSKVDRHGTRWQIASLPFGGYVKFLGDANAASVGAEAVAPEVNPRNTMTGAPLWARTATVAAGPIFNFILAAIILAGMLLYAGAPVKPTTVASVRALPGQFASDLVPGDVIISIGGVTLDDPSSAGQVIPVEPKLDYVIMRDGVEMVVQGPYPVPPAVVGFVPRSAADDAGLKVGDVIAAIDGQPIFAFDEIVKAVTAAQGAPIELEVLRGDETLDVTLSPREVAEPMAGGGFKNTYRIGISGERFFDVKTEGFGVGNAITTGFNQVWFIITVSLSALGAMVTGGISTCNLSGPVGILETSGAMAEQGWDKYIFLIAQMSTAIGLLNLLPIPVLDGGHLVFHAYEAVFRRKPSERVLGKLMTGGIMLVGAFMLFGLLNDTLLCP